MNEMNALRELRAEVPEPSAEALRVTEARILAELTIPPPRPLALRIGWRAALAAGMAAVVAIGVVSARVGHAPAPAPLRTKVASPPAQAVSVAQVLDLAAQAAETSGEIAPKPNQFIVYESITMYPAFIGDEARYLYRTKRKIWLSADGTRTGALRIEHLEPKPYPGWPIPSSGTSEAGKVEMLPLCPSTGGRPRDHVHLSKLPTDPQKMLAHLREVAGGSKGDLNYGMWQAAGDLIRESYLPPAQRAALYRAIKLIPGVEFVAQAEDAAGRSGVAVGFVHAPSGVREQLIFSPTSYRFLGERAFVVDAAKAGAPVGSQLAGTAELSVTVADSAPAASPGPKGQNC